MIVISTRRFNISALRRNKIKEDAAILLISKEEAVFIRETFGDYAVKKTHSKHPKYYLIENPKYLKKLNEYRKQKNTEE